MTVARGPSTAPDIFPLSVSASLRSSGRISLSVAGRRQMASER